MLELARLNMESLYAEWCNLLLLHTSYADTELLELIGIAGIRYSRATKYYLKTVQNQ